MLETLGPDLDVEATILPSDASPLADQVARLALCEENDALCLGPLLGEGGMGIVHLAQQPALGREVAVKTLRPERCSPQNVAQLLREAWVMGSIQHPYVVPIHQLGRAKNGAPMLLMKRIDGNVWRDLIQSSRPQLHQLEAQPRRRIEVFCEHLEKHLVILTQVANAIGYAHSRGVLHRDIKPDNVMVGEFGEVYLLDWGVAVSAREEHRGRIPMADESQALAGTPAYMAPEMLLPSGQLTERTDVFLLGATLHELLTGEPPYQGSTPVAVLMQAARCEARDYPESVPKELVEITRTAMAKEPAERYPSAEAFKQAIESFLEHRSSLVLAADGASRLETLRTRIFDPERSLDPRQCHELYIECRFALQQALQAWPENTEAHRLQQELFELMGRFELQRGELDAAEATLQLLEHIPAELATQLARLREDRQYREEELDKLRTLAQDLDMRISSGKRGLFFIFLALVFGAVPLGTQWTIDATGYSPGHRLQILTGLGFSALVALAMALGRRTLMSNRANRSLFVVLLLGCLAFTLHRISGYLLNQEVVSILVQDTIIFSLTAAIGAVTIDRRILAVALTYLLGHFVSLALPAFIYLWLGLLNLSALAILGYVWLQQAKRESGTG